MKLITKIGVSSLLLSKINAQFDSAFDSLNIASSDSVGENVDFDLLEASGDIDQAEVAGLDTMDGFEVRKFNVPGWTNVDTHEKNGKKNKWKKSIKKNRKRIKAINSYTSSPFGMLAALRAATKKKIFNPSKISSKFVDYGCWCFQSEEVSSFRLPAVDTYDAGCENLVKCETCIKMDFVGDEKCTNLENGYPEYNATITRDGTVECNNSEGTCERAYCECHKSFAVNFPSKVSGDRQYHASRFDRKTKGSDSDKTRKEETCVPQKKEKSSVTLGMEGRFDEEFRGLQLNGFFTTQSPRSKSDKPAKKDLCCGEYPERYPFSSFDGDHGCCGGKTFDKASKDCCGNAHAGVLFNPFLKACCSKKAGTVADFGTCP